MKLYSTLFLILCSLIFTKKIQAQQDARYSQYMFNGLVLNPGYAGSAEATVLSALYRKQWVNIDGAPQSITASAHSALGLRNQYGVGGFLEYDEIGVHQRIRAYLSYAYRFQLAAGLKLGLGIQGGFLNMKSNWTEVTPSAEPSAIDPVFQENARVLLPNFGLGLYLQHNNFYVGASVPHLLNNKIKDGEVTTETASRQYRHYLFSAGVVIPLGSILQVVPSALVKTIPGNAPTQFDVNLSFVLKKTIWLGSSFRFENQFEPESVDFILSFLLKDQLRIGYAYDLTLSKLQEYTSGSHEAMLSYTFGQKKERIRTPRYF